MKRVAFMFPGQGSQAVGMGKVFYDSCPDIQELYQEANQALDKNITKLMFEGPKEELTETENAQPALLLSSIAIHTLLLKEQIQPVMTVGHSLGEYSALVAAGSIPLDKALPLVATRGKLMEEAFPKGRGTMAAVLGLSEKEIEKSLQEVSEDNVVDVANLNSPGQIVISGSKEGIEEASAILKENGAKRILPLNVSGPFHSKLMKSANAAFTAYLNDTEIKTASIPVYANVSAAPVTESAEIKDLLIKQLYSPVRFEESIRQMIDQGVDAFVEVGNGKVLSGLVKKINRRTPTFAVQDIESMNDFISWYREES
ncbi:ACP S-malonyltransferase [Virgibacillus natechei]|uniref:ACP S-malonyltransferase n=1 Tax=Virgibacillus sp. CBA3643 TaxID=2942278 RepID=UPI0035A31E41